MAKVEQYLDFQRYQLGVFNERLEYIDHKDYYEANLNSVKLQLNQMITQNKMLKEFIGQIIDQKNVAVGQGDAFMNEEINGRKT